MTSALVIAFADDNCGFAADVPGQGSVGVYTTFVQSAGGFTLLEADAGAAGAGPALQLARMLVEQAGSTSNTTINGDGTLTAMSGASIHDVALNSDGTTATEQSTATSAQTPETTTPVSVGGCGTVSVPGGQATFTITERQVPCATAVAITQAFADKYSAAFYSPGASLPPATYVRGWDCGLDASGRFSCDQGTTTVVKTYFDANLSNPRAPLQRSLVSSQRAAKALVTAYDALVIAHPGSTSSSAEICTIANANAQIQFFSAIKIPCAVFVALADAAYGANTWAQPTPTGTQPAYISGCPEMGAGKLPRADGITVNGISGPIASDLCSVLSSTGNWQPAAG